MDTITTKNGKGKAVTYTLPEVPADFINGNRALAVLKRFIRAHHEDEKTCRAAVRKMERIFSAPRLNYLKFEVTYTKSRTWGWVPHVELWAGDRGRTWYHEKATASGCGYDKASAATDHALHGNKELAAAWQRLAIENYAKIKKFRAVHNYSFIGYYARGFEKAGEFLPHMSFDAAGLEVLKSYLDALGWKKEAWVSGRTFDYCDYYKPGKKH